MIDTEYMKQRSIRIAAAWALLALASIPANAQTTLPATPTTGIVTLDMDRATAIIVNDCSRCHAWAADYGSIMASGLVVAGHPEESKLVDVIEAGYMPPSPPAPTPGDIEAISAWIAAGAPAPSTSTVDAASGATPGVISDAGNGPSPRDGSFLGFPSKAAYHRAAGWTSAGLLMAAGVVGAIRAYDLMSAGHDYRDAHGIGEDQIGPICYDEIASLWRADQTLRWTHVGLLIAGETVYLGNAITGISMLSRDTPGVVSRSDLHRYAFFIHAGLMASEVILGFVTSDALSRGDHELVSSLGVAHAAIGLTIPLVVIGSGIIIGP